MRYQQVYSAVVFSKVPPECIYISTMKFYQGFTQSGSALLTITNMQINLSTTQRGPDDLSTNFAENVGPDDTVVFGPARQDFHTGDGDDFLIQFDRPFRYSPAAGNLLLDVRIFNGAGPRAMNLPRLTAFDPSTDGSARVWSTNVTDAVAVSGDTIALETVVQFSGIPGLAIKKTSLGGTNFVLVIWPAQPHGFGLQQSDKLGAAAVWQGLTNYDHAIATNILGVPENSLGKMDFYRLLWESGEPLQPGALPLTINRSQGALPSD